MDTATEVWEDLRERFSDADPFRLSDLIEEIHSIKQGNLTVTEYFTNLKILWDELLILRPLPSCSCEPKCKCGMIDRFKNYVEEDYVIRFLKGLGEGYSHVKSQILMMSPMPNIKKTFGMVLKHERQSNYSQNHVGNGDNQVLTVSLNDNGINSEKKYNQGFNNQKKYGRTQCNHCGMLGHIEAKCFKKHGYPPNYKGKGRSGALVNQASVEVSYALGAEEAEGKVGTMSQGTVGTRITQDQYQYILNLLQKTQVQGNLPCEAAPSVPQVHQVQMLKSNFSSAEGQVAGEGKYPYKFNWILDSGASHHISYSLSLFASYKSVSGVFVRMPNGVTAPVTHIGSVHVSPALVLNHVLFVPTFSFNLISLSQLVQDTNYSVLFAHNLCVIQDNSSQSMIESANLVNGIYHLQMSSRPVQSKSTHPIACSFSQTNKASSALWHYRLGHPSARILSLIHNQFSDICTSNDDFDCLVYPLAKQKTKSISSCYI